MFDTNCFIIPQVNIFAFFLYLLRYVSEHDNYKQNIRRHFAYSGRDTSRSHCNKIANCACVMDQCIVCCQTYRLYHITKIQYINLELSGIHFP